ncbi:hypothetical protein N9Z70_03660 [Mariniblastus sp.]|nr:hypothetical protein [Mariniblastus sp.]
MSLETVSNMAGDDSGKPILSTVDKIPADLPDEAITALVVTHSNQFRYQAKHMRA